MNLTPFSLPPHGYPPGRSLNAYPVAHDDRQQGQRASLKRLRASCMRQKDSLLRLKCLEHQTKSLNDEVPSLAHEAKRLAVEALSLLRQAKRLTKQRGSGRARRLIPPVRPTSVTDPQPLRSAERPVSFAVRDH